MQVGTLWMNFQSYDVAFLFLFCHAVHQQKLLATVNVGVELDEAPVGAYFK